MENIGLRAIVEMADFIKNPKAITEAAEQLKKAFALSEEELEKRNQYNDLLQKGNAVLKECNAAKALNDFEKEEIEKAKASLQEAKNLFITESDDARKSLCALQEKQASAEADIIKRQNVIREKTIELEGKEKIIIAKENELRAREQEILSKEIKWKKVIEEIA